MVDPSSFVPEQDDSSSAVVTTTHSAEITQVQLVAGIVLTVLAGIVIVYTLVEIQRHHNRFDFDSDPSPMTKNELELESNDESSSVAAETSPRLRRPLPWFQKIFILFQVGTLILLNYLLLVYLPASISLSVLAAFLIWCLTLHQVILDECCRRSRFDRVLVIVACFLLTAASLSLATFARLTQLEGTLYRGPARIIGYNTDRYSNKNHSVRTDLIVSFGGEWGCPENPTECKATLNGALCQDKYMDASESFQADEVMAEVDDAAGRGRARHLGGNTTQDDLLAMNQELQNELDQEKEENQELEQDLEDEEDTNEELEQDLEEEAGDIVYEEDDYSYYGNWSFDDGYYDDAYWSVVDWDSVWGEYACGDLFTSDIELMEPYDYNTMPGNDSWPYVAIYGSCNSCNAYLVDYFSTEHFASINSFLTHSRYYGAATAVVGLLALFAALKQRLNPSHEKEIELLSTHGRRQSSASHEIKAGPPINTALFD